MVRNPVLLDIRYLLQLLSLEVGGHGFNHRVEPAFHDEIELMQRQADSMVRQTVLREVIRTNLLAAIAAADH